MKTVTGRLRQLIAVSFAASAMLAMPQAFAVGTDAGISISNEVTVDYTVGTAAQASITSDPADATFVVDRLVTFTLAATDVNQTNVAPNDQDAITAFILTNTSNSPLDFRLSAANLGVGGTANGLTEVATDGDMEVDFEFRAANGDGGAGVPDFGTDESFVDALPEGDQVVIYVYADAPITLTNGQIALIELTATAADPGAGINPAADGALGLDLVDTDPNDDATIENVFSNGTGFEVAQDGYTVVSAALTITKSAAVIDDPVNVAAPFYAIPGATIEYTIEIENTGPVAATGIEIDDTLNADLVFVTDAYDAGSSENVSFSTGGFCVAEDGDTNGDGCSITPAGFLEINGSNLAGDPIVVGPGATLTISFQVTIDAT